MIDCLSNGRLISGFARGIPREYQVHNVTLAESRARFEEAYDIITRAWTEEVFSYEGRFWSYQRRGAVAAPGADSRIRRSGCRSSAARNRSSSPARHNLPITPGLGRARGLRDDIIRFYATCLAEAGHRITPDHLSLGITAYVADSKAQALKRIRAAHPLFQPHPVQPRQFHRDREAARNRLCERSPRPIMCGRRTCARRPICARISAT